MEAMAADMVAATGPVLIVHGDSGRMVPSQNSTALARHLPTATVTVFPDPGHGFGFGFGFGFAFQNYRSFVDAARDFPCR
jgi:pimeloyl-ACP methyl ester carboxylesterase